MLFPFSEEQALLQKTLREFIAKGVVPLAAQIDREERFPAETFAKLFGGEMVMRVTLRAIQIFGG